MKRPRSWPLVLLCAGAFLSTPDVSAQSHDDSTALLRVLGAALRGEARQVLSAMNCYPRTDTCRVLPRDSTDVLMGELAHAASAIVVHTNHETVPPCPWGYDPPRTGSGFRVGIGRIGFSAGGDSARVLVLQACDNPPGYVHDIFARDFEYQLARQARGEWRVIERRLMRVTAWPDAPQDRPSSRCTFDDEAAARGVERSVCAARR